MPFLWPLRMRALSTDSACSTATESSVASSQSSRVPSGADPPVDPPEGGTTRLAAGTETGQRPVATEHGHDGSTARDYRHDRGDADHHGAPHPQDQPPTTTVYVHNARAFPCALCTYTARDFSDLSSHRRSCHRRGRFSDLFASGCACGTAFPTRAAAARHALGCLTAPRAAALSSGAAATAGAPSPTAAAPPSNTTTTAQATIATAGSRAAAARAAAHAAHAARSPRGQLQDPSVASPRVATEGGKRRRLNDEQDDDTVMDGFAAQLGQYEAAALRSAAQQYSNEAASRPPPSPRRRRRVRGPQPDAHHDQLLLPPPASSQQLVLRHVHDHDHDDHDSAAAAMSAAAEAMAVLRAGTDELRGLGEDVLLHLLCHGLGDEADTDNGHATTAPPAAPEPPPRPPRLHHGDAEGRGVAVNTATRDVVAAGPLVDLPPARGGGAHTSQGTHTLATSHSPAQAHTPATIMNVPSAPSRARRHTRWGPPFATAAAPTSPTTAETASCPSRPPRATTRWGPRLPNVRAMDTVENPETAAATLPLQTPVSDSAVSTGIGHRRSFTRWGPRVDRSSVPFAAYPPPAPCAAASTTPASAPVTPPSTRPEPSATRATTDDAGSTRQHTRWGPRLAQPTTTTATTPVPVSVPTVDPTSDEPATHADTDASAPTTTQQPRTRTSTRWGPRLLLPAPAPYTMSRHAAQPVPTDTRLSTAPPRTTTRWGPRLLLTAANPTMGTTVTVPPEMYVLDEDSAMLELMDDAVLEFMDGAVLGRLDEETDMVSEAPLIQAAVATVSAALPASPLTRSAQRREQRRRQRQRQRATATTAATTTDPPPVSSPTPVAAGTTALPPLEDATVDAENTAGAIVAPTTTTVSTATTSTTNTTPTMMATPSTGTAPPCDGEREGAGDATGGMWLLQFDGACRRNPAPGGAGAALFAPGGAVKWTCSHFMPGEQTNNTAEYTALLVGLQSAVQHEVTALRVEGDSHLVLSQVRGTYACANKRLRAIRNQVQALLKKIPVTKLVHVDRKANQHADRLANRALDTKRTATVCAFHRADDVSCSHPDVPPLDVPPARRSAERRRDLDDEHKDGDDDGDEQDAEAIEAEADVAARDGGELHPALPVTPDAFPERQPRLRLRKLTADEYDAAAAAVAHMASALACRVSDAPDWSTGEGYICAFPAQLRDALRPFSVATAPRPTRPPQQQQPQQHERPPRVTTHQREHRLDEALDDLTATQAATPGDRHAMRKARRRVARIRSALAKTKLREQFAKDERACVEGILAQAAPDATDAAPAVCPISGADLEAHFMGTQAARTEFNYDAPEGAPFRTAVARATANATAGSDGDLTSAITADDVEDALRSAKAGTSPGHDGVGYDVLKMFASQLAPLLAVAFDFCSRHARVPSVWKVGNVRLIHKKGDQANASNWRPICLQPTVYKVYTALLAQRLSSWLEATGRLPATQKGFRPVNGCHENNFVSTSLLDQSRRLHRKLYVVWYDLKDAFGSVPHDLLWRVLEALGVAPAFVAACKALYDGAVYTITNAADGTTGPIRRELGVFQGCPLSPLLFITALSPLQRALEQLDGVGVALAEDVRPSTAAYADDMKLFSDSVAGIQRCHDTVAQFLSWTGLRANANKCAMLAVTTNTRGNPVPDTTVSLQLHGDAIPMLGIHESYSYLGVGDGFDHVRHRLQLDDKIKQIKREAVALLQSDLAPWQILKALKVYVYPKVEYALRHVRPLRSQLEGFDRAVVRGVRHLLRLGANATTTLLYAPTSSGGLGLLPLTELHDSLQVAHAWQMLHSVDPAIRAIAREQVAQICRMRHKLDVAHWTRERQDELVRLLLNSELAESPHAPPKRRNGDIGSLWTDVQRHLRTWGLKFSTRVEEGQTSDLHLQVPHHRKWLTHKTVLRHLKLHRKLAHRAKWAAMVDQGRTVREHGNEGSKFVTSGGGLSDAEYRFALQARLNQLDTNSVLKRRRLRANATCRAPGCTRAETSAHVLNHCAPNMDAIRQRHDDALAQISAALERARSGTGATVDINKTVPEYEAAALRPDIVLRDSATRSIVIADLAITHEDQATDSASTSSLQHSREHKIAKYQPIAEVLERHGWRVQCTAIVYGTLGSVLPSNFAAYTELLGLLKRDAKALDRQLSSHCIKRSRRIWNWHCSQHRMRQHGQQRHGSGGNRAQQRPATQ